MPRSGTTLVEQILSSHDKVYGAGELDLITNIINKFFMKKDFSLYPEETYLHQVSYIPYLILFF